MSLHVFHPQVAGWFSGRIGEPTEVQGLAWPSIAAGEHVLVSAPTGSGKTLTAFLWSLNQLLTGTWSGGGVQVLYVSPLRALNNDIRRNLLGPLAELEETFRRAELPAPKIRVVTRSGDTPSNERQRMIRNPPEILITTPETLNILLTSKGGRSILGGLRCVILDEIHAAAGSKRGTHLMTAVERLTLLSGEFQRIALSATVRPAEEMARFVGGQELVASPEEGEPVYRPRPVQILRATTAKAYQLDVVSKLLPKEPLADAPGEPTSIWDPLIDDLQQRIHGNRSTLLFANSRRVTEKVTRLLNENQDRELAYSHHGSLSREIRAVVEERLKQGRLDAIVSTSSLELGIDIGALDEVVLLRTPPSIAAAVQRLGRAGHGVGETSRGSLYPLFDRDLLEAVAVVDGVREQDIEETRPIRGPLDVLAQVVLSMVVAEPWIIEDLFRFLRTAHPYRDLTRQQFELVLEMLAGRYADSRIRELRPRVTVDRLSRTVRARPGAARLLYTSGGTIPDRGYFHLRLQESKAKLGELDEEFVWERSVGDTFTLGAQSWQVVGITHNDVLVRPAHRGSAMAPFWRAEERSRSFHLSQRIGNLLERAEETLAEDDGEAKLVAELESRGLAEKAARDLVSFLEAQRAATGSALPHRHHLLVELGPGPDGAVGQRQAILHAVWGGRVLRPLALALAAAWEKENEEPLQIEQDNDCLMLLLPKELDPMRVLRLVHPDNVERLLRERLEQSGFFGARFRENAGRALLLPRGDFRRRVPLWFNRQRAKKLLNSVRRYEDFPVLVETWRTCLQDEFDLHNLARLLAELENGEITWSETTTTTPSPFAADIVWKQTNRLMYEDDQPEEGGQSPLRQDLLRELVFGSQLRPRLPASLVDTFEQKLQRLHPGYAPQGVDDLVEWVRERVLLPLSEWHLLLEAVRRDRNLEPQELESWLSRASERLAFGSLSAADEPRWVTHVEQVPRLAQLLGFRTEHEALATLEESAVTEPGDADPLVELVAEWIRFYGPFDRSLLEEQLGLDEAQIEEVLETLVADERVVIDQFRQGLEEDDGLEICDTENLERLLRLLRAAARPSFVARPAAELPLFLASRQGLTAEAGDADGLMEALERLFGFPAAARLWESDLLPARLDPYYSRWLDSLFHDTDLVWVGTGREQITLSLRRDLDLLEDAANEDDGQHDELAAIFPPQPGRYSLDELVSRVGGSSPALSARLWELAWQGKVTNTTFQTLRRAALNRFRVVESEAADEGRRTAAQRRRGLSRRGRFERWQAARADEGDWWSIPAIGLPQEELDALDMEELNKDRVRLLLDRYGLLFRELLLRELPVFRWAALFRTLRLMELSGEVLSGQFFEGIPGLQFISPAALRDLREGLPRDAVWWINAVDPASPCGLGLEPFRGSLPARRSSSHLVFHGSRLVVVSQRSGGELQISVPPEHPDLSRYLAFLEVALTRQFDPKRAITVEAINGEPARQSPYGKALEGRFESTREPTGLKLRRRF